MFLGAVSGHDLCRCERSKTKLGKLLRVARFQTSLLPVSRLLFFPRRRDGRGGQAWSCDRLLCDSWIEIASHKVTKLQTAARLAKRLRDRKAVGDNVGRGPQKFTVGYTRRLGGGKGKSGAMIVFLASCSAGWCPPI